MNLVELKNHVRTVVDWPIDGVRFRDVTPLFETPECFRFIVDFWVKHYRKLDIQSIAGVDARGFIIGGAVAYEMGIPLILVRKKGKLPFTTLSEDYELEYGTATIEVHADACQDGKRIAIVDDLIATGGTLLAASRLLKRAGGNVVEVSGIIDLPELRGSTLLREAGLSVSSMISFTESE